jgi:hypothetical protein
MSPRHGAHPCDHYRRFAFWRFADRRLFLAENELRERRWGFAHLLSLMVKWGAIYDYHSNLYEICIQDVSRLASFMHLYLLCNCIHFLVKSM